MRKQLTDLRRKMAERGIDAYIVPTTDFHGSEYVNDHFKCREYISGFTGSAGTLVVTAEDAGLWTDGRYFLQASQELSGSGIHLMKMNMGCELERDHSVICDLDLAGEIWADRPKLAGSAIYALPMEVTGESAKSKLERIRRAMAEKHADFHLITSLEEIASVTRIST